VTAEVPISDEARRQVVPGAAYGGRVAERLRADRFAGRLPFASARGEAGSPECGSVICLELDVVGDRVADCRYQAYGCPATLASAAEVCARVLGRTVLEAASISSDTIADSLELVTDRRRCADLAIDALHHGLGTVIVERGRVSLSGGAAGGDEAHTMGWDEVGSLQGTKRQRRRRDKGGVLVGMSGGVDSTVAALLLRDEGYVVVGATLKLWGSGEASGERACCSPETVARARRVAHSLGLPHFTLEAGDEFYERVVRYFLEDYEAGRTPNPCAKCNARLRFPLLAAVADDLGLSWIATGHYARLRGEKRRLTRGVDLIKDQSYVLAEVSPRLLARTLFPLGDMTKAEVRTLAAERGVEGFSAAESQEICFIPDDDYRAFVRSRLGALPGTVCDESGASLAEHSGTYNFTIGQRKALGVGTRGPLYVVDIDAAARRGGVCAPPRPVAWGDFEGMVWHRPSEQVDLHAGWAQVRSSGRPVRAQLEQDGTRVVFRKPIAGVAAGQTAVVYDDDEVVVAGTIAGTAAVPEAATTEASAEPTTAPSGARAEDSPGGGR
jgi:tRNA-uridine 2-sulfurtransferase